MKLKAYEKIIACEQATSKFVSQHHYDVIQFQFNHFGSIYFPRESEERSTQLQNLLDNNVKLKQK